MWLQNWGEFFWEGLTVPVPSIGFFGISILVAAIMVIGVGLQRGQAKWARWMLCAVVVVIPLAAYAGAVVMPNTFANGTVADANEVNANFDTLVVESNSQDGRINSLEMLLPGGVTNLEVTGATPQSFDRQLIGTFLVPAFDGAFLIQIDSVGKGSSDFPWGFATHATFDGAAGVLTKYAEIVDNYSGSVAAGDPRVSPTGMPYELGIYATVGPTSGTITWRCSVSIVHN